jgi:beta-galactosidase/beta-glucuronidase
VVTWPENVVILDEVSATQPDGTTVATASGSIDATIRVPNPHLWSPDDPYLYDISVALTGTGGGDTVGGYFGMRSIGLKTIDGVTRIVLNGNFVFQSGMLDQGFWPDGIHTAPTDDALKSDIQQQKNWGFNMIRKHIKVEPNAGSTGPTSSACSSGRTCPPWPTPRTRQRRASG